VKERNQAGLGSIRRAGRLDFDNPKNRSHSYCLIQTVCNHLPLAAILAHLGADGEMAVDGLMEMVLAGFSLGGHGKHPQHQGTHYHHDPGAVYSFAHSQHF